jgi:hypothetical protein
MSVPILPALRRPVQLCTTLGEHGACALRDDNETTMNPISFMTQNAARAKPSPYGHWLSRPAAGALR